MIRDSHKAHPDISQDPSVCPSSVMETGLGIPNFGSQRARAPQHDMVILAKPSSQECPLGAPISCPRWEQNGEAAPASGSRLQMDSFAGFRLMSDCICPMSTGLLSAACCLLSIHLFTTLV